MMINVIGESISENELNAYQQRGIEKFGSKLEGIDIHILGEDVELTYHIQGEPFERVRRITGYLVGTLDQWNDAKQAEERDRVKHSV